jgi:DNA-directed RNA polymerase subunit RPC12/RpoP
MELSCIHCGRPVTISAEQLGSEQECPHCGQTIVLPEADNLALGHSHYNEEHEAVVRRKQWLSGSFSALASCVIHMAIVLAIAIIPYGSRNAPGEGTDEDVLIGALPSEQLTQSQQENLDPAEVIKQNSEAEQFEEPLEVEAPAPQASDAAADLAVSSLSPSSGGDAGSFDLGAVSIGGAAGGGGDWEGMVQGLRRTGLDIVITFDSTGSMSGEINQVKEQISRIGTVLTKLIPKARISICTYRDEGDEFVVKGLPLTSDISEVQYYLNAIEAGGGGDHPEAVHAGLQWAVNNNQFRPQARKVILLFGDAPPHREKLQFCLAVASDFQGNQNGVVSTVTCRSPSPLPEFYEIAQSGGGEAFLTSDQRQIMTQLMVLVFGSRHREKVIEAFRLLDR